MAWASKTLGEICREGGGRIQTGPFGSQLHESDYSVDGIPVVMPTDIVNGRISTFRIARVSESHVDRLKRHQLSPGDIVYGRRGDIGRQALVNEGNSGWLCGTGCLKISLGNGPLSHAFLHRYLSTSSVVGWIEGQAVGATMPNLNTGILERVPVCYPEEKTIQEKIAAILSAYDDLIANNQRRIALLESMAEEIYREWFVRMRFPGATGLSLQEKQPFDRLCTLSRGFDLPDSEMQPGEVPVIAATTIKGFHSVAKVKPPVVTTGRSGSLGTVLYANESAWPLNTALYVKDFKGNSPYVVFYTLKNLHLENFNAGAGVPTLNRNHLAGIRVFVPPRQAQTDFDGRIGPIFQLSEKLKAVNVSLISQRDALLPRLISGKLRVDQLDIQYPPSMVAELAQVA